MCLFVFLPSTDTGTHVAAHAESKETKEPKESKESKEAKETARETAKEEAALAPPAAAEPTPAPVAAPTPRAGGRKKRARETVAADDTTKAASDAAGSDCTITIGSRPWAEVWIDGKNTNKHTPFADYKIACGKHKVQFKRADLQIDQTEAITVSPGEKFKQSFSLVTDGE